MDRPRLPAPSGPRPPFRLLDLALLAADVLVLAVTSRALPYAIRVEFVAVTLLFIAGAAGYRHRLSIQPVKDIPRVTFAVSVAAFLVGSLRSGQPEAVLLFQAVLPSVVGMGVVRIVSGLGVRALRARGFRNRDTVIVGAGVVGQRICRHVAEHPEYGLRVVGFVDDAETHDGPVPVVGRVAEPPEVVGRLGVLTVIVAFGVTRESTVVDALRECDRYDIDCWAVPRFFEMGLNGGGYDDEIWGLPLIQLRRPVLRTTQWRLKRLFDTAVASGAVVLLSPLLLAVAVAVKATSRGPVFFRQRRIGQRGTPFDVLKFRTMQENDDDATTWTVTNDGRVTRLGRILRPLSIDELPQLLNVIRGDMSLVGPRPERPVFVEEFSKRYPRYADRHRVPVGMTGLAQVNGLRGNTSIEDRSIFDNYYIETWSLWNDIVILLRTVAVVLRPPPSVRVERVAAGGRSTRSA